MPLKERTLERIENLELEGCGYTNARSAMDHEYVKQLADSIYTKGIVEDLLVWRTQDKDGVRKIVLDGKTRLTALRRLMSEDRAGDLVDRIPVVFFEGSLAEARIMALTKIHRRPLSDFDLTKEIYELAENEKIKQKDLAEQLNVSQALISRRLTTFRKASSELLKIWRDDKLPMDTVMDIAQKPEVEQSEAIDEQLKLRASGKRRDAGLARAKVKKEGTQRASTRQIAALLDLGKNATAEDPYVLGMMDMARFVLGQIGLGEFENSWKDYLDVNAELVDGSEDEEENETREESPEVIYE